MSRHVLAFIAVLLLAAPSAAVPFHNVVLDDDGNARIQAHVFDDTGAHVASSPIINHGGQFADGDYMGGGYFDSDIVLFDDDGNRRVQAHLYDFSTGLLSSSSVTVNYSGWIGSENQVQGFAYHAGEMAILDDDGFRLTEVHFFDAATGARNGSVTIDFSGLFPENDLVGAGYDGSYVSFFDQDGGTQLQVHRFDAITGALVDSSVVVDHGGFFASNDLMGTGMIDVPEPSHAMLLLGASGLWIAGRRPRREEAA